MRFVIWLVVGWIGLDAFCLLAWMLIVGPPEREGEEFDGQRDEY